MYMTLKGTALKIVVKEGKSDRNEATFMILVKKKRLLIRLLQQQGGVE